MLVIVALNASATGGHCLLTNPSHGYGGLVMSIASLLTLTHSWYLFPTTAALHRGLFPYFHVPISVMKNSRIILLSKSKSKSGLLSISSHVLDILYKGIEITFLTA